MKKHIDPNFKTVNTKYQVRNRMQNSHFTTASFKK